MSRTRLFILGCVLAAVGFGGMWWGQHYIEANPGLVFENAILGLFNVAHELPLQARAALFLKDVGLIIGIVGLVLAVVAFVLKGGKGRL